MAKTNGAEAQTQGQQASLAVVQPQERSLLREMAEKYGMAAATFNQTIKDTIFPHGQNDREPSNEELAAFLMVAREYDLNPFVKEIYAFRGKGGGIVPIVSIDGWITIVNRQPAFDGMEFEDRFDNEGKLFAITCRMHRKDRIKPIETSEYLSECRRDTDPWKQWPHRMLRHKALIQCARYAFGLAGIFDPDEADRIIDATPDRRVRVIGGENLTDEQAREQYHGLAGSIPEEEPAEIPDYLKLQSSILKLGVAIGKNAGEVNMLIGQSVRDKGQNVEDLQKLEREFQALLAQKESEPVQSTQTNSTSVESTGKDTREASPATQSAAPPREKGKSKSMF